MEQPARAIGRIVSGVVLGIVLGAAAMAAWLGRAETEQVSTVVAGPASGETGGSSGAASTVVLRDGMYLVGTDLMEGRYVTRGTGGACYYRVTSDLSGSLRSVVTTYFGDAFGRRVNLAEGQYFETDECGGWTREAALPPELDQ